MKSFCKVCNKEFISLNTLVLINGINRTNWENYLSILCNLDNVVTLLDKEHYEFHSIYGNENNLVQFNEFKNNYSRYVEGWEV